MSGDMRVLLISGLYPPWHKGGPEVVAFELHRALRKKGLNVLLLAEAPKEGRLEDVVLTKHHNNIVMNAITNFIVRHTKFRSLIKDYDVIHFQELPGLKNLFFPEIALRSNKKLVVTLHGSPRRELKLKKRGVGRVFSSLNCSVAIQNISKIDNIIVNSYYMKEIIKKDLGRMSSVIPNGVNLEKFRTQSHQDMVPLDGDFRVLFWGRISDEKGIDLLIKSARYTIENYPSCHYYIIGDGPNFEEMLLLTRQLGLEKNIHFLGFRTQEEISMLAKSADVTIFPFRPVSNVSDNAPLSVLEAMATGKAIISTKVGGLSELIEDGRNGLLAEPDPLDISKKTILLIEDMEMRTKLGNNAFATAESYSWDRISEQYIKYYEGII
jgi:glycosyltransferase involved in cell wall biosynthesis